MGYAKLWDNGKNWTTFSFLTSRKLSFPRFSFKYRWITLIVNVTPKILFLLPWLFFHKRTKFYQTFLGRKCQIKGPPLIVLILMTNKTFWVISNMICKAETFGYFYPCVVTMSSLQEKGWGKMTGFRYRWSSSRSFRFSHRSAPFEFPWRRQHA